MSADDFSLVDSHCHLPLLAGGAAALDDFVARAQANGVEHLLCVAVDLETFPGVTACAERYACVSASVGVHPNTDEQVAEPTVDDLLTRAAHPDVVAIGETGLDYFRSTGDLAWQRERFRVHIAAARAAGLPLIIHCREAATDVLAVLRAEGARDVGGVMHCFVEDWDTARAAMDLGFYISLSGIVTFRSAAALQDVARRLPRDRLLVETDAPWLAPMPHRGKPNEPAYVRHTAEFLARLRGEDFATLATATTANFYRLFGRVRAGAPGHTA